MVLVCTTAHHYVATTHHHHQWCGCCCCCLCLWLQHKTSQLSLCAQFVETWSSGWVSCCVLCSPLGPCQLSTSVSSYFLVCCLNYVGFYLCKISPDSTAYFRLWSCLCWEFKAALCLHLIDPRNRWENHHISAEKTSLYCRQTMQLWVTQPTPGLWWPRLQWDKSNLYSLPTLPRLSLTATTEYWLGCYNHYLLWS